MDDPRKIVRDFRELLPDYAPNPDALLDEEDDRVRRLKTVISHLDDWKRNVIVLYADCGSLRKLGKRLDLSHSSTRRVVEEIRQEILDAYYEMVAEEINQQIKTKK